MRSRSRRRSLALPPVARPETDGGRDARAPLPIGSRAPVRLALARSPRRSGVHRVQDRPCSLELMAGNPKLHRAGRIGVRRPALHHDRDALGLELCPRDLPQGPGGRVERVHELISPRRSATAHHRILPRHLRSRARRPPPGPSAASRELHHPIVRAPSGAPIAAPAAGRASLPAGRRRSGAYAKRTRGSARTPVSGAARRGVAFPP
jgi:hypothetical protein